MTAGQPGRITELTEAHENTQTYKHKNNHEHNNTSWGQIRINARETEGQ